MRMLITGGAGFIGSHLCKHFLDNGHKVICVDDFSTGRKENIADFLTNQNFKFIERDIAKPLEPGEKIDQIFNFACPASPPRYQKDPIQTMKTSILGSLNMLELARKNNARIMQASTSEVYGDPKVHPQPESYWGNVNPIGVRSCYDEGKRAAETLFFDYQRKYGTDIRVVRIFNTYGPNMDPDDGRVVSNFITQALKNEDLTIYGDGMQTRSFQYIDDLVAGIIKMMDNEKNFLGPVNLGNPDEFTVKELAEKILEMLPESKSKIVYQDLPQDDPKQRKPDISLAKKELTWEPKIRLEEGLKKTIDYFRTVLDGQK
ncbi:MAG: NAD-dependent dehydratase [Candidatus Moranbacteria bacterium RIFOXYB1_FULL_44_23]|nr:MAG: NAD-dependent dehydratase [Candidatus Moranbacteria bacterium RIFOXYA1_FULL_44_8]OGI36125.1 MAG: NAD-dependent dehydratase [Candidatus Moranbacteria bacterium RIFOXYC1_FULL_44_8]OGI39387.1 MAG: NAD-dependent dehydratase [Candidatus Moranbacteria bacterium RIFOXYB1_FULL_44_23]HBB37181.1 NAD-dependent dehydratase [Candidatus Moranbacteria bacterium]HBU24800.1 NAD-dependent dehydratase [Candidatus Moranbacteria bacterium]